MPPPDTGGARLMQVGCVLAAVAISFGVWGQHGPQTPREVGRAWAQAIEREKWSEACDLMTGPPTGCEQRLAELFGGRRVQLHAAGGFRSGGVVTDNVTRFAVTASRGSLKTATYYEIQRWGGRNAVAVRMTP